FERHIIIAAHANVVRLATANVTEDPRFRAPLRNLQIAAVANGITTGPGKSGHRAGEKAIGRARVLERRWEWVLGREPVGDRERARPGRATRFSHHAAVANDGA